MPTYRLYEFKDQHILRQPRLITAESDSAAIERAKQYLDGADLELWDGGRLVVTLSSRDKK